MTLSVHSQGPRLGAFIILGKATERWLPVGSGSDGEPRVFETYEDAETFVKRGAQFSEVIIAQVSAEFLRQFQFVQKKAFP